MSYEIENITKTIEIRRRNGNVPLLFSHVRDYDGFNQNRLRWLFI